MCVQIPDRRLPKYAAADADLALADKGLMKRVLEELQDMHGPQLAKFHLLEKWLLLQAHTRCALISCSSTSCRPLMPLVCIFNKGGQRISEEDADLRRSLEKESQ